MARCGCNAKCYCVLKGVDCMKVVGLGTPISPYIASVKVDNVTLFCENNKLTRKIVTQDTNTVDIEGNGSLSTPLEMHVIRTPDANVPDPDALGFPNLVKERPNIVGPDFGIYVSCEDVQDCVGA